MDTDYIIDELERNGNFFHSFLNSFTKEQSVWRPAEGKWNALEIVCHLYDEEREDFRTRFRLTIEKTTEPFPSIDPVAWVEERNYAGKDFQLTINDFLDERKKSVEWLRSFKSFPLDNYYEHPKFGKMTAKMFLSNWLAHDYIHIRQILKIKYAFLKNISNEDLIYAGPSLLP